jgi:undecaprenyl-diphosphatase
VESLVNLNRAVFFWINQDTGHHYAWLDWLMMFLSDARNGAIPLVLVSVFVFWRSGKSGWVVVAGMVLLVLLSDWSGALIKHAFAAERPCDALDGVRLLAPYCGRNSFPSNHAMNMAAIAAFIGWRYRIMIAPLAALAVLVGLSRIYVGVHYPGDVLFGWIWGAAIASAFYWLGWKVIPGFRQRQRNKIENTTRLEEDNN